MKLGKALKTMRGDMTQSKASQKTKLTVNYISLLETDARGASLPTLEKLAKCYHVKVWEIIKLAEEKS